jgi:hypothetical protein
VVRERRGRHQLAADVDSERDRADDPDASPPAGRGRLIRPGAILAAVCLAACSGGAAGRPPPSSQARTAVSPSSRPCAALPAPVLSHPVFTALPAITLASGLDQPDDLLQDDRRLLIGEMGAGRIVELGADGRRVLPGHVNGVEGVAVLNGVLYAADQPDDRVVSVGTDGALHTLIQLAPAAGVDGVDGIAAGDGEIIVPDSARGRVLWVRPDGTVTRTVGGFSRPAGAFAETGGHVLVADENLGGVFEVRPDGSRTRLGDSLPEADDVVQDAAGDTYAVAVHVHGDVLAKLVGGRWQTLASGSWEPQGLAVDPAGNLEVADPSSGRVYLFVLTSRPVVPDTPVEVARGQAVCLSWLGRTGPAELVPPPCTGICSTWVGGAWLRYRTS